MHLEPTGMGNGCEEGVMGDHCLRLGDFFAGAGVDPAVEFTVKDLGLGLGVELPEQGGGGEVDFDEPAGFAVDWAGVGGAPGADVVGADFGDLADAHAFEDDVVFATAVGEGFAGGVDEVGGGDGCGGFLAGLPGFAGDLDAVGFPGFVGGADLIGEVGVSDGDLATGVGGGGGGDGEDALAGGEGEGGGASGELAGAGGHFDGDGLSEEDVAGEGALGDGGPVLGGFFEGGDGWGDEVVGGGFGGGGCGGGGS